jgi:hypothetical protein
MIFVCKHCGSAKVAKDASYFVNTGECDIHDCEWCAECGEDGSNLIIEVKVPDDFDVQRDEFDLSTLGEKS